MHNVLNPLQNLVSSLRYDCPLLLTTLTSLGEIALLAPAVFETQRPAIVRDFVVKELLMKDRVCFTFCTLNDLKNFWNLNLETKIILIP